MLAQHEEELSLVDLVSQQLAQRPKLEKQIFSVLQQRQYLGGTVVTNLENELANFIGAKHCVCVGSGTSALLIALLAINIKTGDEVIISPFDVIASAQMIALLGAKPVFVDIEPATYTLDPLLLKSAITSKTKAIIAANVFGQCADFNSINEVANQHSLPVIENAAQSVGATYHNLNAGTLSTIGCTSFSPAQPLSTYGEGGACFTNDDELANKMRQLRDHGQTRHNYYQTIGINSPLNTLQASLLLAKLQIFPQELESRTQIAANYTRLLKESVKTPMIAAHNTSVYSQYAIEVKNRHDIQQQLQKQGIPTAVPIALPIHLLPAFARPDVGNFPIAEQVTPCILSLPMHPYLTVEVQTEIVNALKSVL
ncbi:MAG: aminotransferase DegT [Candidatus Parabeggiatoa sp. nov. 1]|nr:MAG: aminotransferase DegT [Gammaproteobacteria bacterium]